MKKRRTADEVARLLRDVDRDLAKGLTVSDACRKIGIAETTYYRWRQRHDPATVDADRRCRELESEVERLKRLVAELMLDKQMLQDIAKKAPQQNLWVRSGSGSRPRLCKRANLATLAVRKPYDFLVTNFTLLFRPSTAPDDTSPLARNQFRINGR